MSKKVKKAYFPTQDCIHLRACRRINNIANKHLFGDKGTQKMSRGCNVDCSCYKSFEELRGIIDVVDNDVRSALSTLSSYYEDFTLNNTDYYQYVQSAIHRISTSSIIDFFDDDRF